MARPASAKSTHALAQKHATNPSTLVQVSLQAIELEVGGRGALVAALSYAPKSTSLTYLLGIVGDPMFSTTPLADLCAKGGITPGELLDAYKSGELNRAQALATARIGTHLAAVAQDTMARSLPQEIVCPICEGLGQVTPEPTKKQPNPSPEPCKTCRGKGRALREGDLEHKKLALEMGKLLSKGGGGINLAVNQQVGVSMGSAGGTLERLQAATDQILYGDAPDDPRNRQAVDAELADVVEAEDPSAAGQSAAQTASQASTLDGDWRDDLDAGIGLDYAEPSAEDRP